jgi:hypothetical protein
VYGGLVPEVDAAPVDTGIQVAGDADGVVAGIRAVFDTLRDWANVHVVLRLLQSEPLDVQLERLATVGRLVLPRLREEL